MFAEFATDGQDKPKFANYESLKNGGQRYKLIDNEEDIIKIRDLFLTTKNLSLDTETTSTEAISAELVGLSFAIKEKEAYYVPIPAEREEAQKIVNIFKPVYENEEIIKIGQNLK